MSWEIKRVIIVAGIFLAIGAISVVLADIVPGDILLYICISLGIVNAVLEVSRVVQKHRNY